MFCPPNSPDLSRVQIRAGDYAVEQLSDIMSGGMIVDGAVTEYERLCAGAPAIAFCVDIKHSKLVAEAFRRAGYRAEHVDGTTPRRARRELIAALDNGDLDILSNCGLISEGLDVPGVVAAILLRPTRSLALYLQMVGRALRPGKPMAHVLDHAGNTYRHGLPTARRYWSLHGRQQPDGAADGLVRCPHCGAMNERGTEVCENCGAQLGGGQRREREVVRGRALAEAIETPETDAALAVHVAAPGVALGRRQRWLDHALTSAASSGATRLSPGLGRLRRRQTLGTGLRKDPGVGARARLTERESPRRVIGEGFCNKNP